MTAGDLLRRLVARVCAVCGDGLTSAGAVSVEIGRYALSVICGECYDKSTNTYTSVLDGRTVLANTVLGPEVRR